MFGFSNSDFTEQKKAVLLNYCEQLVQLQEERVRNRLIINVLDNEISQMKEALQKVSLKCKYINSLRSGPDLHRGQWVHGPGP